MTKKMKASSVYLLISLVLVGLCAYTDLSAMPPHPKVLEEMRRSGDKAGLERIRARAAAEEKRGINRIQRPAPVQGNFRLL